MTFRRLLATVLAGAMSIAACGDDGPIDRSAIGITQTTSSPAPSSEHPASSDTANTADTAVTSATTTTTTTTTTKTTTTVATTTTEPEIVVPSGILAVVPQQNREDPSKNQFQAEMVNGTRQRFDVIGVQFVWDGFTSIETTRDSIIVGGQIIDFPIPFPGADCAGDGTMATMPDVGTARVVLTLEDGSRVEAPVYDVWHLARKLYLDDCERQMIDDLVTIEWVDLHEEQFDGRPVTAGSLRLTRRSSNGTIRITAISNTIPHEFEAINGLVNGAIIELGSGANVAEVPIQFLESRCDPHALAEVKQPYKFVAQVDLGDATLHPYIIYPPQAMWVPMRLTADAACVATGQVVFVGDESSGP
jgi:hypothetical protein